MLEKISKHIGHERRRLALQLGIQQPQIEQIEQDFRGDSTKINLTILQVSTFSKIVKSFKIIKCLRYTVLIPTRSIVVVVCLWRAVCSQKWRGIGLRKNSDTDDMKLQLLEAFKSSNNLTMNERKLEGIMRCLDDTFQHYGESDVGLGANLSFARTCIYE